MSAQQKKDLFAAASGDRLDPLTRATWSRLLVDSHREELIGSIAEQFEELKHEHERVVRAHITSAQPLDRCPARRDRRARWRSATARRSKPSSTWTPQLLGGARVQVGDQVIHASVRDALAQMAAALTR